MARPITAETYIRGDLETVRNRSQDPTLHVRWDVRFTDISRIPQPSSGDPQRFRYATRLGFGLNIEGWGETVMNKKGLASALKFGSNDPKSLIADGAGSWVYEPQGDVVRFATVYDYRVRYSWLGRACDALAFRPLMTWAVRWSFDRLRLWIEEGISPERLRDLWIVKTACLVLLGLVWVHSGLVPKILDVRAAELALVARSGLTVGSPSLTLQAFGGLEITLGLWLLSTRAPRVAILVTSALMVVLAALVLRLDPASFSDPYAGIAKDLGLLGCALTVWVLTPITPRSSRAKGER